MFLFIFPKFKAEETVAAFVILYKPFGKLLPGFFSILIHAITFFTQGIKL